MEKADFATANHVPEGSPAENCFVFDYTERRVPVHAISYLAVANSHTESTETEDLSRVALHALKDLIEPLAMLEEDFNRENMSKAIVDAFHEIDSSLRKVAKDRGLTAEPAVSLSLAIATRNAAFIGHVGRCRVFLLHEDRLFDLTPGISDRQPVEQAPEMPTLFELENAPAGANTDSRKTVPRSPSQCALGSGNIITGYNDVALSPGDVIIISSDGMCKAVSEREIATTLISSINLARAANRLERLAAARNPSEHATLAVWRYKAQYKREGRKKKTARRTFRSKLKGVSSIAALALVLALIFTLGIAFGWRIADPFLGERRQVENSTAATEKRKERHAGSGKMSTLSATSESREANVLGASSAQNQKTGKISGIGVRLRSTPVLSSRNIIGLLKKGDSVTIISETIGPDGKAWYRISCDVYRGDLKTRTEGFVRSDLVEVMP